METGRLKNEGAGNVMEVRGITAVLLSMQFQGLLSTGHLVESCWASTNL